jgi:hypothetical protein
MATVERFDHPGLFLIRLHEPSARSISLEEAVLAHPRPGLGRAKPTRRQGEQRAYRYCSGCSRETEHVLWGGGWSTHIPSVETPVVEPASGTTICQACGQSRTAASRPMPLVWSSWPRKPDEIAASRNGRPTEAKSTAAFDDGAAEEAAENEGMPPMPERPSRPVVLRARTAVAAGTDSPGSSGEALLAYPESRL